MNVESVTNTALAIRMTCSNPAVCGGESPLVLVSFTAGEPAREIAGALQVSPGSGDRLVARLAERVRAGERPPAVVVQDTGTFRIREARKGGGLARLEGTVAVVTGGAQGFGLGIAEELAVEGACLVIADVNATLGEQVAADLNGRYGEGAAVFCRTDVTDSTSLETCMNRAAETFGGVDMFISNAGVLKAGGLDEMDEAAFDLVTKVNYKGFYLCARAAAAVMREQHRHNPRHFMDIIEINSKSGLEGSNRNFAYAGSKFGGIGLTQSFALELIEYNIRVNAICPGNFFDGPLWSDPERGLFVQYLQAGKVEGARTIEDAKQFYMSKVPMKRGCTPRDVARAVFYLHEQEYETGQAVPVTGGQVMLR